MSHYYKDGKPVYELPCSTKEGSRFVTIRDVKKLGLDIGVTTVLQQLDKPGLLRYRLHQVIKETLSNPFELKEETFEDNADKAIKNSQLKTKNASSKGDQLHNALEGYFNDTVDLSLSIKKFLEPVIKEIKQIGPNLTWTSEKIFNHKLGFGGKVDLHCSSEGGFVVDFKSKDSTDIKKFKPYPEHLMQVAAYREGLQLPKAKCFDIYFSSIEPGIVKVHQWSEEELQKGWKCFQYLLRYWQTWNDIEVKS